MNLQTSHHPILNKSIDVHKSRTWVEIDKKAILHNIAQLKNIVGPSVALSIVAKSNAYGHGLIEISKIIQESDCADWISVFNLSEGLIIREAGFKKNILILGHIDIDVEYAILNSIDLAVFDLEFVLKLNELAQKYKTKIFVHVKVDTGLSRLGIFPEQALELIKIISKLPFVSVRGIFSHFSESDSSDQAFTNKQLSKFNNLLKEISNLGITIPYIHSSNTAGLIRYESCHFNFVRSGGGTYGLYKSTEIDHFAKRKFELNLKLALTWKSRVMQIKELPVGTYVSYARTFITTRKTKIAIIPIGYWDGYNRHLSNKGLVYIRGSAVPVLGRICMNMIMIDITEISDAQMGDEVILIGNLPGITPDDIAQLTGTINYEVATRINPIIARIVV